MTKNTSQSGLTLIEVMVYIVLLVLLGTTLTLFITQVVRRNAHAQATTRVLDNARSAMSLITQEVRQSNGLYTPTSVFDSSPGQLSLATALNTPTGETETYVDFYIDDQRLYRKRESQSAELITSEQVLVTDVTFTHLHQSSIAPAVRISMTVIPANTSTQAQNESTVTLTTTTTLRAN